FLYPRWLLRKVNVPPSQQDCYTVYHFYRDGDNEIQPHVCTPFATSVCSRQWPPAPSHRDSYSRHTRTWPHASSKNHRLCLVYVFRPCLPCQIEKHANAHFENPARQNR